VSRVACALALALLIATATSVATAHGEDDGWSLTGKRVRIQAAVLGPGWHEGLFTSTRVPAGCDAVLLFKPRVSRRASMEGAREVSIEEVTALEVDAGPSRPMQDWVGLPPPDPSADAWRPVAVAPLREASARCRARPIPKLAPGEPRGWDGDELGRASELHVRVEPVPERVAHEVDPARLQLWIDARTRHRLSHAHARMARALGMNPNKLGKIDTHRHEPWKVSLPEFIEHPYFRRFGERRPDAVVSIEDRARQEEDRKALKRAMKRRRRADDAQG
jgi:hypothetical protein